MAEEKNPFGDHPFRDWVGRPIAVVYWWGHHLAIISDEIIDGLPALLNKHQNGGMAEESWSEVVGGREWFFVPPPSVRPRKEILDEARKMIGEQWSWFNNCEDAMLKAYGVTVGSHQRERAQNLFGAMGVLGLGGAAWMLDWWIRPN